ncbi:MAG: amidohydrolase, partial [Chloroflexi bacterium]|nr:amidohydrolase [Chloroflexota bacterium]
ITLLMFEGVLEQFSQIKFVLGHLGGTIPYIAERIDRGYEAYPEVRRNISEKPSFYFKRNCYYDTVAFEPQALQFAIEFAGAQHVLLGSDYPHQIGDMDKAVNVVQGLPIDDAERAQVLGSNAARLLHLS